MRPAIKNVCHVHELLAEYTEYLINSLTFLFTLGPVCCPQYMGQEATLCYFLSDNAERPGGNCTRRNGDKKKERLGIQVECLVDKTKTGVFKLEKKLL